MQPKSTHMIIERATLEAVASYLATQPWVEVNGLIAALGKAQPLPPPAKIEVEAEQQESNGAS